MLSCNWMQVPAYRMSETQKNNGVPVTGAARRYKAGKIGFKVEKY
jgi:hypothetical protein